MNYQRKKIYKTPLNAIQTITLPSNLLSQRPPIKQYQIVKTRIPKTIDISSQQANDFLIKKQAENIFLQDRRGDELVKRNVLYKRINEIKEKNQSLEAYSYSKLLSKMVFNEEGRKNAGDNHEKFRSLHVNGEVDYRSIKGKTFDLQVEPVPTYPKVNSNRQKRGEKDRSQSMHKTARMFQRFYNPKNQRISRYFQDHNLDLQQKYVYINGVKAECKRIHNFYTSHHYRKKYQKTTIGNNTKISFYSRKYDI